MIDNLVEWLNLALRWVHLIAGIGWIGSSFYFMWLDASLEVPDKPKESVEGELWMTHSGGFYAVEKRLIRPGEMPKVLHWFRYEALFTLITGLLLLFVVYYMGKAALLIDPAVMPLSAGAAHGISFGTLIVAWVVYDLLWKYVGTRWPTVALAVSIALLCGLAWGLCHVFSGRGAFIQLGATLGTVMVTNVWMRILPAQKKMIAATGRGEIPDYKLGIAAKHRSVHNSYMTLPVLFMMLSNHYPTMFGHEHNWLVLILLIVVGMGVRHGMIAREKRGSWRWVVAPVGAALVALVLLTAPRSEASSNLAAGPHVSFAAANDVLVRRCLQCHAMQPTDDVFKTPPNGIVFESPQSVQALAPRIRLRVFVNKTMPLANKTGITEGERELLTRWIDQGAHLE